MPRMLCNSRHAQVMLPRSLKDFFQKVTASTVAPNRRQLVNEQKAWNGLCKGNPPNKVRDEHQPDWTQLTFQVSHIELDDGTFKVNVRWAREETRERAVGIAAQAIAQPCGVCSTHFGLQDL